MILKGCHFIELIGPRTIRQALLATSAILSIYSVAQANISSPDAYNFHAQEPTLLTTLNYQQIQVFSLSTYKSYFNNWSREVGSSRKMSSTTFSYPHFERDDSLVEEIFDVKVKDPYRHLEDSKSNLTKQFIKEQNDITQPYLNKCPHRQEIKELLTLNQNYKKIGCPYKRGNKYYLYINNGLQPQSVLYQMDTVDGEPRVFFDPNTLSEDGTCSLSVASFSPNGQYFAYGLSYSGSDWVEIKVKNVLTNHNLPDKLTKAKFTGIEWTHDNKGFFYAQYLEQQGDVAGTETTPNEGHSVYYHLLNTEQSEDILKINFPDHPKWTVGFEVSHDGNYLHVLPQEGCNDNMWFYCDLRNFSTNDKLILETIYDKYDGRLSYLANNGETVYFHTNIDAENFRVAKLELKNPGKEHWVDVIPNHSEDVLYYAEVYTVASKDYILVDYVRKVVHYLELHELEGKLLKKFDLPLGTIAKHDGRRDDNEIFFQFTSFLSPGQSFHFDLTRLDSEPRMIIQSKPKNFNFEDYVIKQVFYRSLDKTEVPMFIIHRKDLVLNGQNPCLLYGYGGFNLQMPSSFNINRLFWLKNFNGVFAVANIRGGGELGLKWHKAGRKLNKQNVFNDFIAAAEYLIKENYTNRDKLAIEGHSNGGLLVAAVSNQRPDLFAVNLCHVGVLDMMRYSQFTIGHAWMTEYGDPKDKEDFHNLIKYSPYHNIPENVDHYPATLLLTADHDDRVVPAHSLKFIAELQYKLGQKLDNTPLLIRVETKAGHGGGMPITKVIDEWADVYSFLYNALQLENVYSSS